MILSIGYFKIHIFPLSSCHGALLCYLSAFDSFHLTKSHTTEYDPFFSTSTTELMLNLDLFLFLLPLPLHSLRGVTVLSFVEQR